MLLQKVLFAVLRLQAPVVWPGVKGKSPDKKVKYNLDFSKEKEVSFLLLGLTQARGFDRGLDSIVLLL